MRNDSRGPDRTAAIFAFGGCRRKSAMPDDNHEGNAQMSTTGAERRLTK